MFTALVWAEVNKGTAFSVSHPHKRNRPDPHRDPFRMRKGFDGLAALAQSVLHKDPFSGAVFAFRGKRGDLIKLLWWDGQGMVLYAKRLERGRFTWPTAATGVAMLTAAQLSMLL